MPQGMVAHGQEPTNGGYRDDDPEDLEVIAQRRIISQPPVNIQAAPIYGLDWNRRSLAPAPAFREPA